MTDEMDVRCVRIENLNNMNNIIRVIIGNVSRFNGVRRNKCFGYMEASSTEEAVGRNKKLKMVNQQILIELLEN